MKWKYFHHPDICVPVIARRAGEELMDLLMGMSVVALSRGWSLINNTLYPSQTAYQSSRRRLMKKGLIACERKGRSGLPTIRLTEEAHKSLSDSYRPERRWSKPWDGRWYLLAYDVPEKERAYRNALRAFVKSLRMGCLQRSVWVSAFDIRPEYDDLLRAADIGEVAFLFESQTVLGLSSDVIVRKAWNMDNLIDMQNDYCETCVENMKWVQRGEMKPARAAAFWHEEKAAYHRIMDRDPLLPMELWPSDYQGQRVYNTHIKIRKSMHAIINK